MASTRQVNLTLTAVQEEIVLRLREGGVEYEERVRRFTQETPVPEYMHVDELDRRFGAIERSLMSLEDALKVTGYKPARGDRPRAPTTSAESDP